MEQKHEVLEDLEAQVDKMGTYNFSYWGEEDKTKDYKECLIEFERRQLLGRKFNTKTPRKTYWMLKINGKVFSTNMDKSVWGTKGACKNAFIHYVEPYIVPSGNGSRFLKEMIEREKVEFLELSVETNEVVRIVNE